MLGEPGLYILYFLQKFRGVSAKWSGDCWNHSFHGGTYVPIRQRIQYNSRTLGDRIACKAEN